ncbi:MAG: ABC transporter permease [Acidobacteriia bacterium]|nr:ABC transporter permease [Terriglobia bacterium]
MGTPKPSFPERFYCALLRLLPFDFRRDFGGEMEETFRQQHDAAAHGGGRIGLFRMWWITIADIFRMAPREHLSVLAQDSRYALRMMSRNLGFTLSAISILGLGIGANTAIFSVVRSVLLKPLPYLQGDRLVVVRQPAVKLGSPNIGFSPLELADYRQQSRSLADLVEYHTMNFTLFGGNEPHRVQTGVVSANFFDFLGVQPLLGRTFRADDDRLGAQPVLILSYEFWKKTEGGDPRILGKTYQMNDKPHIVIGVLPPIPQYPNENDVYMPSSACPFRANPQTIANRNAHMLSVFGRLRSGVTLYRSNQDVALIARRLKEEYPKFYPDRLGYTANASLLSDDLTRGARPLLLVLLGAAAFVLLIGCANVANLILARMSRREQELVIRTAVGAGSGRLLRQLLTESFILALFAAGVGILFAFACVHPLATVAGQLTPRAREVAIDGWVLGFAILCATATTVVFGSVAVLYSGGDVASGLKEGSRTSGERGRHLLRSALIAAQVAFSFVLLIGAGLMVRSFVRLSQITPGFVPQHVFAVGFDANWTAYGHDPGKTRALSRRLLDGVQNTPGVMAAAVASSFPMDPDLRAFGGRPQRFQVEGDPRAESDTIAVHSIRIVTPGYFKTLGIPLVAGRLFLDSDRETSPGVVILSRTLASRRWGREDPLGKRISFDTGAHWLQIVGIVGDTREFGPDRDAPFQAYGVMDQNPGAGALLVRAAGDPASLAGLLRHVVHESDPTNAIYHFETLEQTRADTIASPRAITRMFSLFAVLAFLIAVAGIVSMLALWVRQRTREIGIRVALGATPRDILGSVIRHGMALVAVGLAVGLAGAFELTGALKKLLFEVPPTDVLTYALISILLLAAAFIACSIPAYRAARIQPQVALRGD